MPDQHVEVPVPEEAVQAAMGGHPESWRETIEPALQAAAPFIAAKAVEEERAQRREKFGYREGEDPHGLQEAQGALEGLLEGIDLHDPNCGIPHPADPDQGPRGCTCGIDAIKQRFADAVAESLDTVRDQAVQQEQERLREALTDPFFLEKLRQAIADRRGAPAQRDALADRLESIFDQEGDGDG